MINNQIYHKDYTEFGEPYQLVLPLNLEGLVPDDDSVRLLSHELEDLDYSLLYQAYSYQRQKSGSGPKDHVQDPDLCLFPKYLFLQKD